MDGFNKALNSEGSSFLNVESDDLLAAMRGTSIPADDFGAPAGNGNDFGGKFPGSTVVMCSCRSNVSYLGVDDIDPEMDPELAMALRMSLEEERARQERVSYQCSCQNHF